MKLKNRKILITGGAGFIGSHLVDALIKRGAQVFIIDNLSTGRRENINPKAVFYRLDMNSKKVGDIFKKHKPEIVFHLAFNTSVPQSVENPLFDAKGISGSLNVFSAAVKNGVKKIIMASSAMIYGSHPPHTLPLTEDHSHKPTSPYAISKIAAENYLRFFHETYGVPMVILRYATVYGPRQITGAMADYIRKISAGRPGRMYGDGNFTRDYVYVDDIVRANLLALDFKGRGDEAVINLGSAKEVTLNSLHDRVALLLGRADIKPDYFPGRPGDLARFCVSNKKAREKLGWQPTVKLADGLKKTIEYYLSRKKKE